jgi:hypothetical protein
MFYNYHRMYGRRKIIIVTLPSLLVLFLLGTDGVFSQESNTANEFSQRGTIPNELLRPRRNEEPPRYPIDMVIGPMGQGRASEEAYQFARRIAVALLDGNTNSPALSSANRVFVGNCITALNVVTPRFFRLGSGREEPDGAVSFLIRFAGREEGITGELFIRHKEQKPPAPPPPAAVEREAEENAEEIVEEIAEETLPPAPVVRVWVFEDLVLEEPRTREAENNDSRHRYDFSPYERFF